MIRFELEDEQARKVALEYLIRQVLLQKQYFDEDELEHYKWIIMDLALLHERAETIARFDNTWPTNVTWGEIHGRRW